jgi:hypothetical protein
MEVLATLGEAATVLAAITVNDSNLAVGEALLVTGSQIPQHNAHLVLAHLRCNSIFVCSSSDSLRGGVNG